MEIIVARPWTQAKLNLIRKGGRKKSVMCGKAEKAPKTTKKH